MGGGEGQLFDVLAKGLECVRGENKCKKDMKGLNDVRTVWKEDIDGNFFCCKIHIESQITPLLAWRTDKSMNPFQDTPKQSSAKRRKAGKSVMNKSSQEF